ncbi:peptidase inhibitor family I36 protein [Nonomuraea sp. NPDC050404]|uniref:peptidase inhibitor family I36 protein n=1 Tax=Nonomuraea sp. NPDC050404 TaxID=3155783 RepID=UPI00340C6A85
METMRTSRKFGSAGILAAAAFLAMVSAPAPATAATPWDRCPHGSLCLFSGADGTGTIGIFKVGAPDLRRFGLDNNVRSVWNRSPRVAYGYDGFNYTGSNVWQRPAFDGPSNFVTDSGVRTSSARVG